MTFLMNESVTIETLQNNTTYLFSNVKNEKER